jgi:CRISPR-associated protein Cas1
MTSIYVKEQGAMVRRDGDRLVVSKDGAVLDSFPLANVEQVTLMGNVQLTTQATATLLDRDIDVVYLSSYGKFRGRLVGSGSKQVRLRQQQMQLLSRESFALPLAQAVVDGKIHNQRVLLQRQTRRTRSLADRERGLVAFPADPHRFDRALAGMMQMKKAAQGAARLDSLRGFEGKAAAYYFEAVRTLLDPAWGFQQREYYPPPDPFNALLSFSYSLLLKDMITAVQQVGLDPYLGFFHEVAYGRPSLVLDLMEEWRPLLADAMVLELVNRGSLRPVDFQKTGNPNRPVELGEAGMPVVLKAYGERLEIRLYHPLAGPGGETSLLQAMRLQVRQLAQVLQGKRSVYEPMRAR